MAVSEIIVENKGVREDKWKIIYFYPMQMVDNVSVLIADSRLNKSLGYVLGGRHGH